MPAEGTGPHRYVALLYQHDGRRFISPPDSRDSFDAVAFAHEHEMDDLIAANAFRVIEGS